VILPPLQEQAMLAKLSNSFFTLSHFNLNLNRKVYKSYGSLDILVYIQVKWLESDLIGWMDRNGLL